MACQVATDQWEEETIRISQLTRRLKEGIQRTCPDIRFFGHLQRRLPGNLSIGFPGVPADEVIDIVSDRIAISTGSACSSATSEPSKVLLALGLDPEVATTGLRISLGRFTSDEEIDIAIAAFADIATVSSRT